MDDFGRSLERDYGLGGGRAGKRIGRSSKSSKSSSGPLHRFENSRQFSESFNGRGNGTTGFNHGYGHGNHEPPQTSSSFREGSPRSWNNSSRQSSYSVYDEVFSSNTASTIPVFEDVFRVHSSRMKVSELRDNDIFRGMPDFRKNGNRSRLTYEDIFGEAPEEELSGPFDVAGSKSSGRQSPAPAVQHERRKDTAESSKARSRSATPRKGRERSRAHTEHMAQRPLETESRNGNHHGAAAAAAEQKIQGSFLGLSQSFKPVEQNGASPGDEDRSKTPRKQDGEATEELPLPIPLPANGSSSPDEVERAWLSIGEVSLTTKPSENPPPLRSAPGRSPSSKNSADGAVFETTRVDSGPPPLRVPPPIIRSDEAEVPGSSGGSSELLERVLKERNGHGEISIREKVLDWQMQNLSQQQAEEERQRESFRKRSEALRKLQAEREEVERVAAEVEAAAAEQARVRAERAAVEDMERDARAFLMKQQHQQHQKDAPPDETVAREEAPEEDVTVVAEEDGAGVGQAGFNDLPTSTGEAAEAVNSESSLSGSGQGLSDVQKATSRDIQDDGGEAAKANSEPAAAEVAAIGTSATTTQVQTEVAPEATNSTGSESSMGIDTISSGSEVENESTVPASTSTAGGKEEEPAPETPERLETVHVRHEKSSKSSEIEVMEDEQEQKIKSPADEAPRRSERSLVARINAEVKEKGASAAAAAAAAAGERRDRRTKPRLKQHELEEYSRVARGGLGRVSLREQLEKERVARLEMNRNEPQRLLGDGDAAVAAEAKIRAERTLVERITAEVRERAAANARAEQERAEKESKEREKMAKEKERLERLERARERERERLERLDRERAKERERLEREMEREREIEREKDRVNGLEEKAAKEKAEAEAEAARIKLERAAVERATAEARARAERAAYERVASGFFAADSSRPSSVPKQRFGSSTSMPSSTGPQHSATDGGIRRTTSSTNLDDSREFQQEFQELKGETPERRKARLERYQRTLNRAAQALAQKNKRDLELQTEQAERQRLSERLDTDIRRWSVGKDGNIRALLSTLQYVLWPESGWRQVSLTELISPAAVKKAYRRATLCVHPDKMQQKHASVQQKYIAEKVFHILQVAWNKFNSQEIL